VSKAQQPFSDRPSETVAALGEIALLRAVRRWLGDAGPPPPQGMGDDCAVLEWKPGLLLAKTDGVVLGRHFDEKTKPAAAGAKLFKRNASDIAAMGGRPKHALAHLLLAGNMRTKWLEQFYRGLARSCRKYGVTLAGGGIAQAPNHVFAADLLMLGESGGKILTRTGAKIDDAIYVTGSLGGSRLGHHLDFEPRLAEGQWLARQATVRGLIDVTDGLAKDLPEILPAGADARLDIAALPISRAAKKLSRRDGRSALVHALTDGEDYELLFAMNSRADLDLFEQRWRKVNKTPLTRIGTIAAATNRKRGGQLRDAASGALLLPPGAHGYEHLR
jgi:thiamine-monophosphate kinase